MDSFNKIFDKLADEYFYLGEKIALFEAIEICIKRDNKVPGWVYEEFIEGFTKYREFECGTLDEAFGIDRNKHARVDEIKEKARLLPLVYNLILLHNDGERLAKIVTPENGIRTIFDDIGERLSISPHTAREYYIEQCAWIDGENPRAKKRHQLKNRKKSKRSKKPNSSPKNK